VLGVGASVAISSGQSTSTSDVLGVAAPIARSIASAEGTSTVAATAGIFFQSIGSSVGSCDVLGVSNVKAGFGVALGVAIASGEARPRAVVAASAVGSCSVLGVGYEYGWVPKPNGAGVWTVIPVTDNVS
jgi:hypothetical protein